MTRVLSAPRFLARGGHEEKRMVARFGMFLERLIKPGLDGGEEYANGWVIA